MKKALFRILVLVLVICISGMTTVQAGSSIGGEGRNDSRRSSDLEERLRNVPEFKFYHQKKCLLVGE